MSVETPLKEEYRRGYDEGFQDGVASVRMNTPRARLLRDVVRSGGKDRWSHLSSHGHHYSTVRSAVLRGYLKETQSYCYEITSMGRIYVE